MVNVAPDHIKESYTSYWDGIGTCENCGLMRYRLTSILFGICDVAHNGIHVDPMPNSCRCENRYYIVGKEDMPESRPENPIDWQHDDHILTVEEIAQRMEKWNNMSYNGDTSACDAYQKARDEAYKAAYAVDCKKLLDAATGGEAEGCAG